MAVSSHRPSSAVDLCTIDDVVVNVTGMRFNMKRKDMIKYPGALLGNYERLEEFFDPTRKEYYFNRNRPSFDAIYLFYTYDDELKKPFNVSIDVFMEEIKFFGLTEFFFKQQRHKSIEIPNATFDSRLPNNLFQRRLWLFLEYPESSIPARIFAIITIASIIISICAICLQSLPQWQQYEMQNVSGSARVESVIECSFPSPHDVGFQLELCCIVWFIIELCLRFIASPSKCSFLFNLGNCFELVMILPFILNVPEVMRGQCQSQPIIDLAFFKIVRVAKVLILFKFYGHSHGFKTLVLVIRASLPDISLIAFYTLIGALMFSTAIYFVEGDMEDSSFHSIPASLWWAVITMTTVGYGDMLPVTSGGKIIGVLCLLSGPIALALIIPNIVNQFNTHWQQTHYDYYRVDLVKALFKTSHNENLDDTDKSKTESPSKEICTVTGETHEGTDVLLDVTAQESPSTRSISKVSSSVLHNK